MILPKIIIKKDKFYSDIEELTDSFANMEVLNLPESFPKLITYMMKNLKKKIGKCNKKIIDEVSNRSLNSSLQSQNSSLNFDRDNPLISDVTKYLNYAMDLLANVSGLIDNLVIKVDSKKKKKTYFKLTNNQVISSNTVVSLCLNFNYLKIHSFLWILKVNKLFDHGLIVPSHRALPFIDELLESVHVANTLYSSISSGCRKDYFYIKFSNHKIVVMSFDLTNTPTSYQQEMNLIIISLPLKNPSVFTLLCIHKIMKKVKNNIFVDILSMIPSDNVPSINIIKDIVPSPFLDNVKNKLTSIGIVVDNSIKYNIISKVHLVR
ncbi:hypothetical protein H8356DRAFT_1326817 [Neocallimastix lanati (nom. inval.)]|nr:hypothetical protein H8356DRAFT_1326817 [Neocallimastix sp. JGI-2020a]